MKTDYKAGHIINHVDHGYARIEKIENNIFHLLINFTWRMGETDENKIQPILFCDVLEILGIKMFPIQGGYGTDTSHFVDYGGTINGEEIFLHKFLKDNKCQVYIRKENDGTLQGMPISLCQNYLSSIDGNYLHEIQDSFFKSTGKNFDLISIDSALKNVNYSLINNI